ncbi:MAG: 50S ribosome-binding GTPase [Candidatus Sabulitectum sp.]|nr:50S ribosome-binding GTPase [Candidatus Sabulitectum sp.]
MEQQSDLIAALATPEAVSAISLVRLSGKGASAVIEKLMKLEQGALTGRKRAVGDLAGIDYLVAISWPLGKSYTGEEMVDLMCHGSPGTAARILEELEKNGARLAAPGEFTRRAWLNGRLSSLDVLTLSARYTAGEQKTKHGDLTEELSELTSELEGFIEFSEDHEVSEEKQITLLLEKLLNRTQKLVVSVRNTEILPRVFIMGPMNAGKSTLFNKLNGKEIVVVSRRAGTTRDGATRIVPFSGRLVEISDSAGSGGTELDSQAYELLERSLKSGDRIVWLDPSCSSPPGKLMEQHEVLKVCSLSDKNPGKCKPGWLVLSSVTGVGVDKVIEFMITTHWESPSWRMQRMVGLLEEAISASKGHDIAMAAEIVGDVLREADKPQRYGDAVERALERFCVGK